MALCRETDASTGERKGGCKGKRQDGKRCGEECVQAGQTAGCGHLGERCRGNDVRGSGRWSRDVLAGSFVTGCGFLCEQTLADSAALSAIARRSLKALPVWAVLQNEIRLSGDKTQTELGYAKESKHRKKKRKEKSCATPD